MQNLSNTTNYRDTWKTTFMAIDVVVITLFVLTLWILLCFVIYGTKTNRWRSKPGNSSLSSGSSYILCTIAILTTIPMLVMIEIVNQHPQIGGTENDLCKSFADAAAFAYFLSLFVIYLFLWLFQRRTYQHPYVKERVGKWMNVFSIMFVITLTATIVAICLIYNLFGEYKAESGVCIYNSTRAEKHTINFASAAVVFVLQILLIWASIYTAVSARFPSSDTSTRVDVSRESRGHNWKLFYRWFFPEDSKIFFGPVEKTIRRFVSYTLIIIGSDLTFVLIEGVILPINFPLSLHILLYGLSNIVNVYCMVSMFGFSQKVFSLCCPNKMNYGR